MDWVEAFLHISPDGGSGAFELALLLLGASMATWGVTRFVGRRRRAATRAR